MWYNTGTITVTNASATITGSGTDFISGAQVGEALYVGGNLYEILAIVSATEITLKENFIGTTQSGLSYKIIPTQSLVGELASQVTELITDYSDVKDLAGSGKFQDGTLSAPSITFEQDQNNGLYREGTDNWGLVAGSHKAIDLTPSKVTVDADLKVRDQLTINTDAELGDITVSNKLHITGDDNYSEIQSHGQPLHINRQSNLDTIVGSNVGLNTTPENIGSGYTHLEVDDTSSGVISVSCGGERGLSLSVDGTDGVLETRKDGGDFVLKTRDGTISEKVRVTHDGKVGVGVSNPTEAFEVNGTVKSTGIDVTGTVNIGGYGGIGINSTNNVYVASNTVNHVGLEFGDVVLPYYNGLADTTASVDIGASSFKFGDAHFSGTVNAGQVDVTKDGSVTINLTRTGAAPSDCQISNEGGQLQLKNNSSGIAFKTGSTPSEKARLTSDGKFGLGTSNVTSSLTIGEESVYTKDEELRINRGVTGQYIKVTPKNGHMNLESYNGNGGSFIFSGDGSEKARLTSDGNFGIGASDPSAKLDVHGDIFTYQSGNTGYKSYAAQAGARIVSYQSVNGSPYNKTLDIVANADGQAPSEIRLLTKPSGTTTPSEKVRLTSSGDLLVGKTATSLDTKGFSVNPDGWSHLTRDSIYANIYLNKLNNDGEFISFNKDGSTIGEIGVNNLDNLYISGNSTHAGIEFSSDTLVPFKNGATVDATINLGGSLNKFKDAHFSGTVNARKVESSTTLDIISNSKGIAFDGTDIKPFIANKDTISLGASTHKFKDAHFSGTVNAGDLAIEALEPTLRLTRKDSNINTGNTLSTIEFAGTDASNGASGVRASIKAVSEGEYGATGFEIYTSNNSSDTLHQRAKFSSDGNFLVGTTTANAGFNNTNNGITLNNAGYIMASRNSGGSGYFNRNTDDGEIVEFRKDGSLVGSIGVFGSALGIVNKDTGLQFYGDGDVISPCKADYSDRPNAINLGSSTNKFKDAHFSGTVNCVRVSSAGTGLSIANNTSGIFYTEKVFKPFDSSKNVIDIGSSTNKFKDAHFSGVINGKYGNFANDGANIICNSTGAFSTIQQFQKNGVVVGSIGVSATATAYNTSSDYRLKENESAITDAVERVQSLKPYRFDWKATGERVDGFFAHEVQEVIPEAVTGEKDATDENGDDVMQSIDQSKVVPLLTAALQEALTEIESLKQRLTTLENQ